MSNQEITNKITEITKQLVEISSKLNELESVSHLSKSPVRWQGGVIGLIQDVRENKRLEKLINAPIYNNLSFFNISGKIICYTEELVDLQKQMIPDEDFTEKQIQDTGKFIVKVVEQAIASWLQYSPDMANATLTMDGEEYALAPSVQCSCKEKLSEMELTEDYNYLKSNNESTSSGCFSVLLVLFVSSLTLLGVGGYGVYELLSNFV